MKISSFLFAKLFVAVALFVAGCVIICASNRWFIAGLIWLMAFGLLYDVYRHDKEGNDTNEDQLQKFVDTFKSDKEDADKREE